MTRTGQNRADYAREVETGPSRFDGTDAYAQWCKRADDWAQQRDMARFAALQEIADAEGWEA